MSSVAATLGGFMVACGLGIASHEPAAGEPERRVRDVTELVAIDVQRVVQPRDIDELQAVVARHDGPISIGGGRFSMGGQIATDQTLFLDTRTMDDVVDLDVPNKTIRVESGITWRKIQEAIDPHDLSVSIMQSYANFTVGGSLSVNSHGRYVNAGPLVQSVRSIELVLADGSRVMADRQRNSELFWGAVGGYGALGVIAHVELDLADNVAVERTVDRMPAEDFHGWFGEHIEGSDEVVFFNADLYPPKYDEMVAISLSNTDREVTVPDRLQTPGSSSAVDKFTYWWVSEAPLGKQARSEVIDRMRLGGKPVVWRNYEASYDVRGLDPASRRKQTYVLQEYFIPVENFDAFVPKMAEIFSRYDVNVVNVSIRHATADPDTLLTWAPTDVYAFVVYHKQGTSPAERTEVGVWTREMIDAILSEDGTWYLPYQIHGTPEQFHAAYPRADELFALKAAHDPTYAFRNRLWDAYLPPAAAHDRAAEETRIAAQLATRDSYARPEDQTFLTLPEWYIVYSADELGAHLIDAPPSEFPFFAGIAQFWTLYDAVTGVTAERWPRNTGYHGMIWVIGISYTVEYGAKGLYEATVGRLSEALTGDAWRSTPEDQHYARVAAQYGAFLHHTPWYVFPYGEHRAAMWELPGSSWALRGLERRGAYYTELLAKSAWGGLMGGASQAAYGTETGTIEAWVRLGDAAGDLPEGIEVIDTLGPDDQLIAMPRYEPFSAAVPELARRGVQFVEIAGGRTLLVQVLADDGWDRAHLWGDPVVRWPILTQPGRSRVTLEIPVKRLHQALPALQSEGVTIEHLYDY